jgi:hypothetical protein
MKRRIYVPTSKEMDEAAAEILGGKPPPWEEEEAVQEFVFAVFDRAEIKYASKRAKAGDWKPMANLFRRKNFDPRMLDDETLGMVADKIRDG